MIAYIGILSIARMPISVETVKARWTFALVLLHQAEKEVLGIERNCDMRIQWKEVPNHQQYNCSTAIGAVELFEEADEVVTPMTTAAAAVKEDWRDDKDWIAPGAGRLTKEMTVD